MNQPQPKQPRFVAPPPEANPDPTPHKPMRKAQVIRASLDSLRRTPAGTLDRDSFLILNAKIAAIEWVLREREIL